MIFRSTILQFVFLGCSVLFFASCTAIGPRYGVLANESFHTIHKGESIDLYTLQNKEGSIVQITNYGARVVSIWMKGMDGSYGDVCIGLRSAEEYINAHAASYGAVMGPYAGRIAKGRFPLGKEIVELASVDGDAVLHGGLAGFNTKVWSLLINNDRQVLLEYTKPDGDGGFPGRVRVKVLYELTDDNELVIRYTAMSDRKTVLNLTNHTFFNLDGEGSGTIENHRLQIDGDKVLVIDENCVPTGELRSVQNTPFDFLQMRSIALGINSEDEQIYYGKGYDHTWVLDGKLGQLKLAATLFAPRSKRLLEVWTTEPSLQFYTANFLSGKDIGKHGHLLNKRESLCLETQHFPDSPNHPVFPTTVLNANEEFKSTTIYKFSVKR